MIGNVISPGFFQPIVQNSVHQHKTEGPEKRPGDPGRLANTVHAWLGGWQVHCQADEACQTQANAPPDNKSNRTAHNPDGEKIYSLCLFHDYLLQTSRVLLQGLDI